MQNIEKGDKVRVHIENNCPLGPSTQSASFRVDELHIDRIVGTDPAWGDECIISGVGTGDVRYRDAGKSGEVVRFEKVAN